MFGIAGGVRLSPSYGSRSEAQVIEGRIMDVLCLVCVTCMVPAVTKGDGLLRGVPGAVDKLWTQVHGHEDGRSQVLNVAFGLASAMLMRPQLRTKYACRGRQPCGSTSEERTLNQPQRT